MSGWAIASITFGGLSGFAGLVLLVLDLLKYRKTIGTILGSDTSDSDGATMYAPKVRFRTELGSERIFQSICYFSSEPYPEGQPIPVRYHPTVAWLNGIDKPIHRMFGVGMSLIFAVMFIALGLQI